MRLPKIHQRRRVEEIDLGVSGLYNPGATRYGSQYRPEICAMQEKICAPQNRRTFQVLVVAYSSQPAPGHRNARIARVKRRSRVMECTIKWSDGVQFVAETGSGHAFIIDGAP